MVRLLGNFNETLHANIMLNFDTYYHIYNHANGDDNLFREQKNYAFFLKKYHQHINPIAETIAWCLMPNHFHLLVRIKSEEEILSEFSKDIKENTSSKVPNTSSKVPNFGRGVIPQRFLSKQFANFFSSYTQAFNKVYKRRGSLFIKNFKRKEVHDEAYLRTLVLYIHLNPVKHGFIENVAEWKHSSYTTFPIDEPGLLTQLFEDDKNYKALHQDKQLSFDAYEHLENDLTL